MPNVILLFIGLPVLYIVLKLALSFHRNLQAAKRSNLPYIIVPAYWIAIIWISTVPIWSRILGKLPDKWTAWVDYCLPESTYDYRHALFKRIGHDTYMTVSPWGNTIFTCDADVINQITTRRNDFPKPTKVYKALNIYGPNVVSAEGKEWRHYRKATSPPFTEANNHLVWQETIFNGKKMLQTWLGSDGEGKLPVHRLMDDTMRLSLYVISGAGFGRRPAWPQNIEGLKSGDHKILNDKSDTDKGHAMSWTYALHMLMKTVVVQFILPMWIMDWLPFDITKKSKQSYFEWKAYMLEALEKKKQDIKVEDDRDAKADILRSLVKGQSELKGAEPLTEDEILGNMFVLIIAGHETAANTIHFTIIFLALFPESQKKLQKELDQILKGKPAEEWDYDRTLPLLFSGMAGAILAEVLRLTPAAPTIPKSTIGVQDQPITIEGRDCIFPQGCFVAVQTTSVHRNPNYWPTGRPRLPGGHPVHPISNVDNDLEEFRPERWLLDENSRSDSLENMPAEVTDGGSLGVNTSADTSDRFYKPRRGAYVPFSDGYRSCLGRRFAQVEILALMAILYSEHTIELDVSEYAADAELMKMTVDERAEVWQKAAEAARQQFLTGMMVMISLQMKGGHVPVRLRKRGHEMFPTDVDEIWKRNNPDKCTPLGDPGWKRWKQTT